MKNSLFPQAQALTQTHRRFTMNDTKGKQVPLDNAAVKQKHRLAAGLPVNGQKLPPEPAVKKFPA